MKLTLSDWVFEDYKDTGMNMVEDIWVKEFISKRIKDLQKLEDKSQPAGLSCGKPMMLVDRKLFLKIRKKLIKEAGEELTDEIKTNK